MSRQKLVLMAALGGTACENPTVDHESIENAVPVDTAIDDQVGETTLALRACVPTEEGGLNWNAVPANEGDVFPAFIGSQNGCHVAVQFDLTASGLDFRAMKDQGLLPNLSVNIQHSENSAMAGPVSFAPNWVILDDQRAATVAAFIFQKGGSPLNTEECVSLLPPGTPQASWTMNANLSAPMTASRDFPYPELQGASLPIQVELD